MTITVLRKTEYKGCPVYILYFENVFQYFFFYKGNLYQNHVFFTPRPLIRFLRFFHLIPDTKLFTNNEILDCEGVILNGALSSIDKLLETNA